MTRRERIVFLLEHVRDLYGPGGSGDGVGAGEGPGFALLSSMAEHPSAQELGRCLQLLRRMAPNHARDLETYFACAWYVERVPKTTTRGGRRVVVREKDGSPSYVLRRVRGLPAWLECVPVDRETGEPRTVARGVDFISGVFRGDPFVPEQLLKAAA